ncbi:MAG: BtrH N-terminal domain-containing protein [Candidatus Sulfotelmatobacter sp.]
MNSAHVGNYKHIRGVHCATAALRNVVYHKAGVLLSEALVFGIAAGLGFSYTRTTPSSPVLTMGRGTELESAFCDAMGICLEPAVFFDDDLAWEYVRRQIENQELVMLDTDMFLLPYLVENMGDSIRGLHFGGHKILVTGYDLDAQVAYVADYAWPVRSVALSSLRLARNSADCPSAPQNRSFVFHFPEKLTGLRTAILLGISRNVCLMRNSISYFTGLAAIDRCCRQMTRWNRIFKGEELILNLTLASHMMERAGTGGGNFRNLYSRFLRESAPLLGEARLEKIALIYQQAGRHWTDLSELLDESAAQPAKGIFDPARAGGKLLNEIWELENEGIHALEEIVDDRFAELEREEISNYDKSNSNLVCR